MKQERKADKNREVENPLSREGQIVIGLEEAINRRTQNSRHISTRMSAVRDILSELFLYDGLVPKGGIITDVLPEDKKELSGLLIDIHHYIRERETDSLSVITLGEIAANKFKLEG